MFHKLERVWHTKTIAEVILLCAKQELALRGHKKSSKSQNQGNFVEILNLVSRHDPFIKEKLRKGLRMPNTHLQRSKTHLRVLGGIAQDTICNFIQKAHVFSLLVDETNNFQQGGVVSHCMSIDRY